MIPVVDYDIFVANTPEEDLAMLTSFLVKTEVHADPSTTEILFAQAQRLYDAGLVTDVTRRYFDSVGGTWQGFMGALSPDAVGYIGKLARERVKLSRAPIPVEQPA